MSELSKVTLISIEDFSITPRQFNQDYKTLTINAIDITKDNPSKIFNDALNNNVDNTDIFGFFTPDVDFLQPNVISTIVQIFKKYKRIQCVYTDNITIKNNIKYPLYFPTYYVSVCNKIIINTPFFCRANVEVRFNENLQLLYYFDFLHKIFSRAISWHIPHQLFSIKVTDNPTTQQELEQIINNG